MPNNSYAPNIEELEAKCAKFDQCYCTKGSLCGWCDTTQEAMVGTASGPFKGFCPEWILMAKDCPTLNCNEDVSHMDIVQQIFEMGWFPCAVALFCLLTRQSISSRRKKRLGRHREEDKPKTAELSSSFLRHSQNAGEGPLAIIENQGLARWNEFLRPVRTYAGFRKGCDALESERLPETFERSFLLSFEEIYKKSSHRLLKTLRIALKLQMALGVAVGEGAVLMLFCAIYMMILRLSARFLHHQTYAQLSQVSAQMVAVKETLQEITALMLTFYALNRVQWYWNVQTEGFKLQGRAHDLAMIAGTMPRETEEDWQAAYRLHRHLMLAFYFSYQPFVPRLTRLGPGFQQLEACGLLTPRETEFLSKAQRMPMTVVESWIAHWVAENMKSDDAARQQAFYALREYRACLATVSDWEEQRAPVSFESLLYLLVYARCLVAPFAPSQVNYADREAVIMSSHIAPVIGVGLIATFYLSLLQLLRQLQTPYGKDDPAEPDALHPEAIMLSTERKCRDYLTSSMPWK